VSPPMNTGVAAKGDEKPVAQGRALSDFFPWGNRQLATYGEHGGFELRCCMYIEKFTCSCLRSEPQNSSGPRCRR
jgi:hypothetical protein